MAITAFGSTDAQAVKIWAKLTLREALKATLFNKFLGTKKTAIIQRLVELEKSAGDQIKYDLLMQIGKVIRRKRVPERARFWCCEEVCCPLVCVPLRGRQFATGQNQQSDLEVLGRILDRRDSGAIGFDNLVNTDAQGLNGVIQLVAPAVVVFLRGIPD